MIPAATRYDVTTHAISSTLAEKLPCMCGRETLTIELSSTSSTVPSITENAITHLRVEENSWTSCVVWGIGLGATAIEGILAYGTKGRAQMQKTQSRNTVTVHCLAPRGERPREAASSVRFPKSPGR